jgi:hypothetical protein
MKINEKLLFIQQELKAPKGQYNSFSNFKYRSCEDILEAVKPLLLKYKCILTISDNLENIGERYYIKATAKLTDIETGDIYENVAFAREEETKKGMDGSQITGATSSYARKYALNGLFAIDDTKDADTDEYQKQTKKVEKEPTYREQLITYCKDKELDLKEISKSYELTKESTEEDYKKALTNLKVGE